MLTDILDKSRPCHELLMSKFPNLLYTIGIPLIFQLNLAFHMKTSGLCWYPCGTQVLISLRTGILLKTSLVELPEIAANVLFQCNLG